MELGPGWSTIDVALINAHDDAAPFDRFPGVGVVEALRAEGKPTATAILVSRLETNPYLTLRLAEAGADYCYRHEQVAEPEGMVPVISEPPPTTAWYVPTGPPWRDRPRSGGPAQRRPPLHRGRGAGRGVRRPQVPEGARRSPAAPSCGSRQRGRPAHRAALADRLGPGPRRPELADGGGFREPGPGGRAPTSVHPPLRPGVLRRLELPGHHLGAGNRDLGLVCCHLVEVAGRTALRGLFLLGVLLPSTAGAGGWCRPSPSAGPRSGPTRSCAARARCWGRAPRTAPPRSGAGRCGRRPRKRRGRPRLKGDTTNMGTRKPRPIGPAIPPAVGGERVGR